MVLRIFCAGGIIQLHPRRNKRAVRIIHGFYLTADRTRATEAHRTEKEHRFKMMFLGSGGTQAIGVRRSMVIYVNGSTEDAVRRSRNGSLLSLRKKSIEGFIKIIIVAICTSIVKI